MKVNLLQQELLELICTTCKLDKLLVNDFRAADPLIGPDSPLGIDSLDALEIAVIVQREYGVRMDNEETSRVVMQSPITLSDYIEKHR